MNDLTKKETFKLNEFKKIIVGECTKKEASVHLGITIRRINRLILKYKNEGAIGFAHKNRCKESKNIFDILHYYIIMDKKFKWMQHLQCGMEKRKEYLQEYYQIYQRPKKEDNSYEQLKAIQLQDSLELMFGII